MSRSLSCLALGVALVGCGGGGSSSSSPRSPFAGTYKGTASLMGFDSAGTQNNVFYSDQPTKATVQKSGRFKIVVTDSHTTSGAVVVEVNTITGTVSSTGAITDASSTFTADGASGPTMTLSGGTGSVSTSPSSTSVNLTFPDTSPNVPDPGTARYVVNLQR